LEVGSWGAFWGCYGGSFFLLDFGVFFFFGFGCGCCSCGCFCLARGCSVENVVAYGEGNANANYGDRSELKVFFGVFVHGFGIVKIWGRVCSVKVFSPLSMALSTVTLLGFTNKVVSIQSGVGSF
jgi:hypothetical protein